MRRQFVLGRSKVDLDTDYQGYVEWIGPAAIDVDGTGKSHGDPFYQPQTSLRMANGMSLNADEDFYVVVPPSIIRAVKGIVLGCLASVYNEENGKAAYAVVGDVGPEGKLGEYSRSLAMELGLNGSPISGGTDRLIIQCRIWPGVAAVVNNKTYKLQRTYPQK